MSYDHGAAAIGTLLDAHPDVEAVFCISDLSAVGAVMECQRRGIAVPDRLSVMGFGDFDIGRVINPALTTIRVDFLDLGRRTGELVLRLLGERAWRRGRGDRSRSRSDRARVGGAPLGLRPY